MLLSKPEIKTPAYFLENLRLLKSAATVINPSYENRSNKHTATQGTEVSPTGTIFTYSEQSARRPTHFNNSAPSRNQPAGPSLFNPAAWFLPTGQPICTNCFTAGHIRKECQVARSNTSIPTVPPQDLVDRLMAKDASASGRYTTYCDNTQRSANPKN